MKNFDHGTVECTNFLSACIDQFESLIPVVGSGFTKGFKSKNGITPSGIDMKKHMITELIKCYPSNASDLEQGWSYSKLATRYQKDIDIIAQKKYLENNFTNVVSNDILRTKFIKHNWSYVYTLNIDDCFEKMDPSYEVVLPHRKFNEDIINSGKALIKLHGDVISHLKYPEDEPLILGDVNYVKSIKSNRFLLELIKNDYSEKNLMFIGCSLDDEIDLLYASDFDINFNNSNSIIFISEQEYSELQLNQLKDYGINTFINIHNYDAFYHELNELIDNRANINTSFFDDYSNFTFKIENEGLDQNIHYLFDPDLYFKNILDKEIILPDFLIERGQNSIIIESCASNNLVALLGNRVSGKTSVLVNILRKYKVRKPYFFNSSLKISDIALAELIKLKNSLIIFDTNTITPCQLLFIMNNLEQLRNFNSTILFSVNNYDHSLVRCINDDIKSINLDNIFTEDEITMFNMKIENSNIQKIPQRKNISLLDYLLSVSESKLYENYSKYSNFNITDKHQIALFLMLVFQESLTPLEINLFSYEQVIKDLHSDNTPVVDYKMNSLIEVSKISKYKLHANAKLWIYKTLRSISSKIAYKEMIADAFCHIINVYTSEDSDPKVYSKYIYFDEINELFKNSSGGAGGLIRTIYSKLEHYLKDSQYYHQRAKSLLILESNNNQSIRRAIHFIDLAIKNTENDFERTKNKKLGYSLSNLRFTEALLFGRLTILTNFDENLLEESLNKYHDTLKESGYSKFRTIYLTKESTGYNTDLNQIISTASTNISLNRLSRETKKILEELIAHTIKA